MISIHQTIRLRNLSAFFLLILSALGAMSQTLAGDLTSPDLWKPERAPFSFKYGGKDSAQLLPAWQFSHESGKDGKVQLYSYTDPATRLKITAEVKLYPEFPGVADWVLKLRNDGDFDTPIIEDIMPLHWAIPATPGDCFLRHARGSNDSAEDFTPLMAHFEAGNSEHLEDTWGRSSTGDTLPFFNLQTGDHGLIGAIGWTGSWKADFDYSKDGKTITLTSGMMQTHLRLHPGEEIRTPRIVLMSWTGGDWQEAQNPWRRLLFAHYSPQENGKAMRGPILFGSWGSEPIADKLAMIQWVHDHKIPVEVYAVDAGWYGASVGLENDPTNPLWNPWWKNRGDWFPSPLYYPNGIHPLGEALKADGFGFSLWVEPETIMPYRRSSKIIPTGIFTGHPNQVLILRCWLTWGIPRRARVLPICSPISSPISG